MPTKATKTIKQALTYKPQHATWFTEMQVLFNRVVAFYFEVIQAHQLVLKLSSMEANAALEKLTHATKDHPHPIMPLSEVACDIPTVFRKAAISAALGSVYSKKKGWRGIFYEATSRYRRPTKRRQIHIF